mgnify:FL=1
MSFLMAPLGLASIITRKATGNDSIRIGVKAARKHPELAKKVGGKVARAGMKHAEELGQSVVDSSEDVSNVAGKISAGLTTAAGALTSTGIGAPIAALALSGAGIAGGVKAGADAVTGMKEEGTLGLHQSTGAERTRRRKETLAELYK